MPVTPPARRGFSLLELVVATALAVVVGAAAFRVLFVSQRLYAAASQVMDVQQNLRAAALTLAAELRGLDPADGDLVALADTALTVKAPRALGVLCAPADSVAGRVLLAAPLLAGSRAVDPARDSALVFRDGGTADTTDDGWLHAAVAQAGAGTCPDGTGAVRLTLQGIAGGPARLGGVAAGAPLRTVELVRYRLYADGGGAWWLGQQARSGGSWSATSPVAGPLRPRDGLGFEYRDAAGTVTADRTAVAAIRIVLRGRSLRPVATGGRRAWPYEDSVATTVALRNGRRP